MNRETPLTEPQAEMILMVMDRMALSLLQALGDKWPAVERRDYEQVREILENLRKESEDESLESRQTHIKRVSDH
jgi:hypothetical protein